MCSREHGYEDDRFENVVSQTFHCPICLNVFKDPVMCQGNQHYFCRPCITRHLENSQTCPSCQEELTLETLNKAPRILMDYFSELNIRCDYFSRGCEQFVQLGDLERHVKDCGFTPVLCSNEGCVVEMNKRDRTHHETEVCEFRKVKCHDCSEIRKEVNEVKVNLNEVKMNLIEQTQKLDEMKTNMATITANLDKMDGIKQKVDELAALPANIEKMKEDITRKVETTISNKMDGIKQKVDELAAPPANVEKMKEDITKKVEGTDNDTNKIKPSVVVAGGFSEGHLNLRSAEQFDWSIRKWSPLQPMKECRVQASSFVYKNQLTVAGGMSEHRTIDSMEKINIEPIMNSTQWSYSPTKLHSKLSGHSCVVYNERLITIGGYDNIAGVPSDSINELFLVQPYTRKLLSRMPEPRCYHCAQLCNDKMFVFGGKKFAMCFLDCIASVLMYDINKKECKQMVPLPFGVSEMATVRWGDNVVVIGGVDKNGKTLNTVVIYNVETGKSHMLPEMKCKRQGCTAVVSQGAIVVMGGSDEHGKVLTSVECFTFDHYSWEDLPPMNEARYKATAVGW